MLKIDIIERIKNLPQQNEENLSDIFGILMDIEDCASVDHYVRWVRKEATVTAHLMKSILCFAIVFSFWV